MISIIPQKEPLENHYIFTLSRTSTIIKTNSFCKQLKVFEIEFGTGLNAVLAINWTQKNPYLIDYDSIEPHSLALSNLYPITIRKLVFKIWQRFINVKNLKLNVAITM